MPHTRVYSGHPYGFLGQYWYLPPSFPTSSLIYPTALTQYVQTNRRVLRYTNTLHTVWLHCAFCWIHVQLVATVPSKRCVYCSLSAVSMFYIHTRRAATTNIKTRTGKSKQVPSLRQETSRAISSVPQVGVVMTAGWPHSEGQKTVDRPFEFHFLEFWPNFFRRWGQHHYLGFASWQVSFFLFRFCGHFDDFPVPSISPEEKK